METQHMYRVTYGDYGSSITYATLENAIGTVKALLRDGITVTITCTPINQGDDQ